MPFGRRSGDVTRENVSKMDGSNWIWVFKAAVEVFFRVGSAGYRRKGLPKRGSSLLGPSLGSPLGAETIKIQPADLKISQLGAGLGCFREA